MKWCFTDALYSRGNNRSLNKIIIVLNYIRSNYSFPMKNVSGFVLFLYISARPSDVSMLGESYPGDAKFAWYSLKLVCAVYVLTDFVLI
jgi:hypothetical protein